MAKKRNVNNYGYVFLFYDVGEKRLPKVYKICKKYLEHHQNSVFRGVITPSNLIKLEKEIKDVIDATYDRVTIMKMRSGQVFDEVKLGVASNDNQMFL